MSDWDPNLEVDHIDGNPLNNRDNPNYGGLSEEHKRKISESIKEHYRLKNKPEYLVKN